MDLVTKLATERTLQAEELKELLLTEDEEQRTKLFRFAQQVTSLNFHNKIFIRGIVEFTNHCQRDCFYCGLRASNKNVSRYRMDKNEILVACKKGYALGFRTFVLQGGEDHYYSDAVMCDLISSIKHNHPDCAITLSLGERSYMSYKTMFEAGADRYLLRHETADSLHYSRLHPPSYSLKNRMECLWNLKEIGYQVGTGFIVGAPYQVPEYLVDDLLFTKELDPAMVGIGPFIPHKDTPFRHQESGAIEDTLRLIAILRLMLPRANIPSTTSLATLHPNGRQHGILAGANVVMLNLSPEEYRNRYTLYNKIEQTDSDPTNDLRFLNAQMRGLGYQIAVDRGDYIPEEFAPASK